MMLNKSLHFIFGLAVRGLESNCPQMRKENEAINLGHINCLIFFLKTMIKSCQSHKKHLLKSQILQIAFNADIFLQKATMKC